VTDLHHTQPQDHGLDGAIDHELIALARPALEEGKPVALELTIRNVNRTVGTMLGSAITRRYGAEGLPDGTIRIRLDGSGGQSFGAFIPRGIEIALYGDTNDYLAKGLSGGRIIVRPPDGSTFAAEENVIAGNVIAYGATSGELFISGVVGERFCVRNSGVTAVVEGVGDHACEYMTGGTVVVLGDTGRNVAAGMSGGVLYIYDPDGHLPARINGELVDLESLDVEDAAIVTDLIARHTELTGSALGMRLIKEIDRVVSEFVKVMPRDYRRVLEATKLALIDGRDVDAAVMAAAHG
jgi:glutamate synthase (NADPH/NADH) large chain